VENLTNSNCKLISALKTPLYTPSGIDNTKGIMFTIQSFDDIEFLLLKFCDFEDAAASKSDVPVGIYIRQGSFSGFHNVQSQWTSLAFTQAQLSPDSKTAIFPAHNFEPFYIKANTEYALCVSMLSTGVLKIKESPKSIGNE
jgi:hypothetical protein